MRFPYIGYEIEDTPAQRGLGVLFRPVIPVRLFGPQAAIRFRGLLDTGADETIISHEMAEAIGATRLQGKASKILSAGGEVAITYATISIELSQATERFQWPIVVGVAEQSWDEALLGFRGFLEYFDASFRSGELEVELIRNTLPFAG